MKKRVERYKSISMVIDLLFNRVFKGGCRASFVADWGDTK